jgi:atypical dual specificity phosphatase
MYICDIGICFVAKKTKMNKQDISRQNKMIIADNHQRIMKYISNNMGPGIQKISEITNNIYLAGMEVAMSIDELKANEIKAILYIGVPGKSNDIMHKYKKRNIEQLQVSLDDDDNTKLVPHFEKCYNFIHKWILDDKKVLIHCLNGVSLGPTFVAYYLLKRYYLINYREEYPPDNHTSILMNRRICHTERIFQLLKECRPCVKPKASFIHQLLVIEMQLKHWLAGMIANLEKRQPEHTSEKEDSDSDLSDELFPTERKPSKKSKTDLVKKKSKKAKKGDLLEENYDSLADLKELAGELIQPKEASEESSSSTSES